MAAAAGVMAPADVLELDALGCPGDHLARTRVGERLPDPLEPVWVGQERGVAGDLPAAVAIRPEAELITVAQDDGVLAVDVGRRVDTRVARHSTRELRQIEP